MNRILLVGDHSSETLARWQAWAEFRGYTVELKSLEDLVIEGTSSVCIIMDEHGLNDMPFEQDLSMLNPRETQAINKASRRYGKSISGIQSRFYGQMLHAAIAQMTIVDEVNTGPDIEQIMEMKLHKELTAITEPCMPNTRRSKGDRKGNRKYRWC